MNRYQIIYAALALAFCAVPTVGAENSKVYPVPEGVAASDFYAVTVDGKSSFAYATTSPATSEQTAGHHVSWTSFDLKGPVEVRVRRLSKKVEQAVVRPLSAGIEAKIEGGELVIRLDRPRKLSVECDGDLTDVLFLFANAPEVDVPSRDDSRVVWFEPGVHEIGKFYELEAGKTYYLAPGSFLKGSFSGGGDETRVVGRGILSGADYVWPGHLQEKSAERVDLAKLEGDRLEISGITLVDSPYYVLIAKGQSNRIRDLKIIAWHHNTDGISAGQGARIEDCFLRVADDAFKPFRSDTLISGCVLWVDRASAFQLSWNAADDSGGSVVSDCDIIHHMPFAQRQNEWTGAVFWGWHGGSGRINDILFENIRIEGRSARLISLTLRRNPWSPPDNVIGEFGGITFHNISAEEPSLFLNELQGYDQHSMIRDVTFENFRVEGKLVEMAMDMNIVVKSHVEGVQFLP